MFNIYFNYLDSLKEQDINSLAFLPLLKESFDLSFKECNRVLLSWRKRDGQLA